MAYTATKFYSPLANPFPRGVDNTQRYTCVRGTLVENDTATEYAVGGIGSSSFQVTAFSAVGAVTYSSLKGVPLVNGQRVVISNTASNTNDGTYVVAALVTSSSTAGTFTAVPIGLNALSGTGQTGQTAEGVGGIQWGARVGLAQTFTATAVTVSGTTMTVTYTTLTGPQLQGGQAQGFGGGQSVTLSGMTNAGNNGTFTINLQNSTSSTAGSFTVTNAAAVATDSGTGVGTLTVGIGEHSCLGTPIWLNISSSQKGFLYQWDPINTTVRTFVTGSGSGAAFAELALGANATFDGAIGFEAWFVREGVF